MTQFEHRKYSLKKINEIAFDKFICHIPQETIQIINDLATKVGSPSYVKTPIFNKRNGINNMSQVATTKNNSIMRPKQNQNKRRLQPIEILNDDDWDTIRSFEVTKIEQKEGFEAEIVNIRSLLNMLTEKNYTEKKTAIKEVLDNIYLNNDSANIQLISNIICDIASDNRFYSEIYAKLYTELCNGHNIMLSILNDRIGHHIVSFKKSKAIDINDYEQICKLNKDNDRVKAFSAFIMNLKINGIIEEHIVIMLVSNLFDLLIDLITKDGNKGIVDEIVENISILYNYEWFQGHRIDSLFGDLSYHALIQEFANMKVKQYPSITNKSIFKFMDILKI
jgi:hypothetical protein